ncbi:ribonuclease [Nocardioides agariphilus]|jgi:ribonuclease T1|uniref:Ribonuclease n=1 Tax=Nocardioides agariphilus TaxID=433664 RepID=A0A930VGU9_9ACTN|nr:ribonuclease domain-containing protein [Nocardioides agariphilus]MBF4767299.1 ribonuclease [Nocardioides agariphilus]
MSATTRRQLVGAVVVVVLATLVWYLQGGDGQSTDANEPGDLPSIAVSDLPPEALETLDLIDAGGPFPYPGDDGKVFGNREALLPDRPSGYYHEYTVPTPGSDDRGARRIITGGEGDGSSTEYYWTDDHYRSFERIDR